MTGCCQPSAKHPPHKFSGPSGQILPIYGNFLTACCQPRPTLRSFWPTARHAENCLITITYICRTHHLNVYRRNFCVVATNTRFLVKNLIYQKKKRHFESAGTSISKLLPKPHEQKSRAVFFYIQNFVYTHTHTHVYVHGVYPPHTRNTRPYLALISYRYLIL